MSDLPIMLDLHEASTRSGLTYGELRRLCLDGRIAHMRVGSRGGKFLVNYEKLVEFLSTEGLRTAEQENPL